METVVLEKDEEETTNLDQRNGFSELFLINDIFDNSSNSPTTDAATQLRMAAIAAVVQQPQPEAACRLKLLRVEMIENIPKGAQLCDLTCAVNIKEKVEING